MQVTFRWLDRAGNYTTDTTHVVERYTLADADHINYEATISDPKLFTRPWKINLVLYKHMEKNFQLLEFKCVEFSEELLYGHLRKQQLVKHWEGDTMNVDITRKVPQGEKVYERYAK